MEFKRKIYDYDVKVFALQWVPTVLRRSSLSALLRALISPVESLMARFTNYKKAVEYELTITPQVCYLQKMLNDFYDYTDRRIIVADVALQSPPALYLKSEGVEKGLVTYKKSENPPEYFIPTRAEAIGEGGYFIVKLPVGLEYDVNKMRAHIDKYKLPTTAYNIVEE